MKRTLIGWGVAGLLVCGLGLYGCGSSSDSEPAPTDGDTDSAGDTEEAAPQDGDTEAEKESQEQESAQAQIFLVPVLTESGNSLTPLSWIKFDASGSYLPTCTNGSCDATKKDEARTAKATDVEYQFNWAAKPAFATEAMLLGPDAINGDTDDLAGKWIKSPKIKSYITTSGIYVVSVSVRATRPSDDDTSATCPNCADTVTKSVIVKPSSRLAVEMLWDKGGQTDMDLFLVRYRDNGSFGYAAGNTIVKTSVVAMPTCESKTDCFNSAFECGADKKCVNACTANADCSGANAAWKCRKGSCVEESAANVNGVACKTDTDCQTGDFCSPVMVMPDMELSLYCTDEPSLAINDTVFYNNRHPLWAPFVGSSVTCTTDAQCQSIDTNSYCGFDTTKPGYCAAMSTSANPRLDIDDVTGWGPENISIDDPLPGRYRIVARLWADGTNLVSDKTPNTALTTMVQIYLNGEPAPVGAHLTHDFTAPITYWKVADVIWEGKDSANNRVVPICAGWTRQTCETSADCQNALGSNYTCETRDWNKKKFCSTCAEGGSPADCSPSKVCETDSDCAAESNGATHCASISQKYCTCAGASEFAEFSSNPYANPVMINMSGTTMNPLNTSAPSSIWCDAPATEIDAVNHTLCSTLYAK